jgi:hypothetical protein
LSGTWERDSLLLGDLHGGGNGEVREAGVEDEGGMEADDGTRDWIEHGAVWRRHRGRTVEVDDGTRGRGKGRATEVESDARDRWH